MSGRRIIRFVAAWLLGIVVIGAGVAAAATTTTTYGPWSGTFQIQGPVPDQKSYPNAFLDASYALGSRLSGSTTTYAASVSWSVSGGGTHTCSTGQTGSYAYSGKGVTAGTVKIAWGSGAYTITANTPKPVSFQRTDSCLDVTLTDGQTPLGPATRGYPSAKDNQTHISAIRSGSNTDPWTAYYTFDRTAKVASATPTPSRTTTSASPSASASASATSSASPSATASASPHKHKSASPTPTATPTATATEAAPVAPTEPPAPPPTKAPVPGHAVSGLALHTADYSQISHNARSLLVDAALALLLMLMILFPAELFNGTLMENYDEVRGWFGPIGRIGQRFDTSRLTESRPLRWAGAAFFVAVTGAVYGLVDPKFGWDGQSFRLFVALSLGLVLMTLLANGAALLFVRWRYGVPGRVRLRPGTLALAVICVLISRLVHIEPGYVYGIVAGFEFSRELNKAQEGRAVAAWAGWLFLVSIGAWLLIEPARHLVESHEGAFLPLVGEEITAALTVEGLTVLLLALAPLRFLHGERLLRWSPPAWAVGYAIVVFAFLTIDVHPEWAGTETDVPLRAWLGLFVGFTAVSVAFWGYFRFRPPREIASE